MKDKVWYICYGSNLLLERFELYIKGGESRFNKNHYSGCKNTAMPEKCIPVEIPYNMYFAKQSGSWGNKSVAFLDYTRPGHSFCRAYLVTEEQLDDIKIQEGKVWYGNKYQLNDIDGIPAFTLTNYYFLNDYHDVSDNYLEVIRLGLKETYPKMTDSDIDKYLQECIKNSNR